LKPLENLQRTLRTPRQSINYAVNPLPDSFNDWNKSDSSVVDIDSYPLALKSPSVVQPEAAQGYKKI
jgi:hypothetical protein